MKLCQGDDEDHDEKIFSLIFDINPISLCSRFADTDEEASQQDEEASQHSFEKASSVSHKGSRSSGPTLAERMLAAERLADDRFSHMASLCDILRAETENFMTIDQLEAKGAGE